MGQIKPQNSVPQVALTTPHTIQNKKFGVLDVLCDISDNVCIRAKCSLINFVKIYCKANHMVDHKGGRIYILFPPKPHHNYV